MSLFHWSFPHLLTTTASPIAFWPKSPCLRVAHGDTWRRMAPIRCHKCNVTNRAPCSDQTRLVWPVANQKLGRCYWLNSSLDPVHALVPYIYMVFPSTNLSINHFVDTLPRWSLVSVAVEQNVILVKPQFYPHAKHWDLIWPLEFLTNYWLLFLDYFFLALSHLFIIFPAFQELSDWVRSWSWAWSQPSHQDTHLGTPKWSPVNGNMTWFFYGF